MGFETCTMAPCSPRRAAGELWGTAVTPPAAQQPFLPPSQLFRAAKLSSAPLSVRPRTQGLCTSRGRAWLSGATWPGLVEAPRALGYRPAQAAPSGALFILSLLKTRAAAGYRHKACFSWLDKTLREGKHAGNRGPVPWGLCETFQAWHTGFRRSVNASLLIEGRNELQNWH